MMKQRNDYKEAEKYIFINEDDPDLIPIMIWLPKPPAYYSIAGFGKQPEYQKWEIPRIPERLKKLEIQNGQPRSIADIWKILEGNPQKYAQEIEFIKKQWYHRLYGYWFFNNGVPTYITGKHYYYLCYFKLDTGAPMYRDRDRKYWIAIDFFEKDTWDFKDKDENGLAIQRKDENGQVYYAMYDTGDRVCLGDVYPKFRREGATYRAQCNNLEVISRSIGAEGAIQSRDEGDAKEVFQKKLVPAFKKLPFFFKPQYSNSTDPKSEIVFNPPSVRATAKNSGIGYIESGLESYIAYGSGKEGEYDGHKLKFFHDDEVGKLADGNVLERNEITKECFFDMGKIIGYTSKTSTVGDMDSGGGENFQKLCSMSNFYQRSANGRTASGLYVFFISSTEGYKVDKYGKSTKEQNKEEILGERTLKLSLNDVAGWNELVRKYPIYYRECFTSTASNMGFNIYKIEERLNELRMRPKTRWGNFVRIGNSVNDIVVFKDDPHGRFEISEELPDREANKKYSRNGVWFPYEVRYIAGADPFRMKDTENLSSISKGGGAVFKLRIAETDKEEINDWKGSRFVCTYLYRPSSTDEYCDDMLKMCQYYGALMFSETNVNHVNDYFEKTNHKGYLLYALNSDGTLRKTPGMHSSVDSKQLLLLDLANHIELHCEREQHAGLLKQCKEITSAKRMTDFDLLTAAGLALRGVNIGFYNYVTNKVAQSGDSMNIKNWFNITTY